MHSSVKRGLIAGVLLSSAVLGTTLHTKSSDSGPATYYASDYGPGDWLAICEQHAAWGNAADPCVWSDYWCVHPSYSPGEWLYVSANGTSLSCEIGDTVAAGDEGEWWANGVVELSWSAFVDLGLTSNNWVTVGYAEPVDETPEPIVVPEREMTRLFETTGVWVDQPFLDFWDEHGGLAIFGYPVTGAVYDDTHGMTVQYFERARFEFQDACQCIMLGRVGAEQIGR